MARGCFPLLFVVCSLTTLPLAAFSEGGVLAKFFAWAWVFLFLLAAWVSWRPENRPGWMLGLLLGAFGATCGTILVVIIRKNGIALDNVFGLLVLLLATVVGLASAVSTFRRRPASGKGAPSEMRTVEFKSAAFPKYENEDDETINEHCWGKRLAEFFRDHLPRYGVETEDILCEDWGWLVYVKNDDDFSLWVGCGAMDDDGEPDDDRESSGLSMPAEDENSGLTTFTAFVSAEQGWFKKKVDVEPAVSKVVAAIELLLADSEQIQEIEWYS